MTRVLLGAIGATLLLAIVAGQKTDCGDCDRADCPELGKCPTGVVKDFCGCCDVCAGRMGDRCQNTTEENPLYLPCGIDLVCKRRYDIPDSAEASCECLEEGEVCGSNDVTYRTPCHLVEEVAKYLNYLLKNEDHAEELLKSRVHQRMLYAHKVVLWSWIVKLLATQYQLLLGSSISLIKV